MPLGASSRARLRARAATAALELAYAEFSDVAAKAAFEALNTIEPQPWAFMIFTASREARKHPFTFTSKWRSQLSSVIFSTGPVWTIPALQTRMSTPPKARTAWAKAAAVSDSLVASTRRPRARWG